jgi:SAM-dependent methyltransferase
MRITYRSKNNKEYWQKRWDDVEVDEKMENADVYPLKYAQIAIDDKEGRILEAGCGAGRILRYYHDLGYDITGIDFIESVITKLKITDSSLKVAPGDITNLDFSDEYFNYVLAFGLYHNLEKGLDKALVETSRVLVSGGVLCASFRADNLQTLLVDYLAEKNVKHKESEAKIFHKANFTRNEINKYLSGAGLTPVSIYPVVNMPILYKFGIFRQRAHKDFNENLGRKEGYKLNAIGNLIQKFLFKFFRYQFCNLFVVIAKKDQS